MLHEIRRNWKWKTGFQSVTVGRQAAVPVYRFSARGHARVCVAKSDQELALLEKLLALLAFAFLSPSRRRSFPFPFLPPSSLSLAGAIDRHRTTTTQFLVPMASPASCAHVRLARVVCFSKNRPCAGIPPRQPAMAAEASSTMASPLWSLFCFLLAVLASSLCVDAHRSRRFVRHMPETPECRPRRRLAPPRSLSPLSVLSITYPPQPSGESSSR